VAGDGFGPGLLGVYGVDFCVVDDEGGGHGESFCWVVGSSVFRLVRSPGMNQSWSSGNYAGTLLLCNSCQIQIWYDCVSLECVCK
jgi:hypothetical protein